MTPEQAKELLNTILWEGFCKELDKSIKYESIKLETCKQEDLVAIQQNIKVLNNVKNIPQNVIDNNEGKDSGA